MLLAVGGHGSIVLPSQQACAAGKTDGAGKSMQTTTPIAAKSSVLDAPAKVERPALLTPTPSGARSADADLAKGSSNLAPGNLGGLEVIPSASASQAISTKGAAARAPDDSPPPGPNSLDPILNERNPAESAANSHPLILDSGVTESSVAAGVIGKVIGRTNPWTSPAPSDLSAKRATRVESFASADKAEHALLVRPADQGSGAASPAGNQQPSVQGRGGIADQIKDAVLARVEESRNGDIQRSGRTEIHVRLNPPELGEVRVHLVTAAEQVSGRLVVQHESVRAALESQLPELRHRLEQSGVALGRFDVTQQDRHWAGSWRDRPEPPLPRSDPGAAPRTTSEGTVLRSRGVIDLLA